MGVDAAHPKGAHPGAAWSFGVPRLCFTVFRLLMNVSRAQASTSDTFAICKPRVQKVTFY